MVIKWPTPKVVSLISEQTLGSFGTYIDISKTLTKTTVPEIALAKDLGAFKFDIGYILDREVHSQWS